MYAIELLSFENGIYIAFIYLLNTIVACVAGGIRGHERMGSLKYRLPKNDTF
jgi:hypothetical protein